MFYGTETFDVTPYEGEIPTTRADDENIVYKTFNITQKNARINIVVRGLPQGSTNNDYYFGLNRQNLGYDYNGEAYWDPADQTDIRESGQFNNKGEYITPAPFYLIHDFPQLTRNNCMILTLYKTGETRAGDTEVTSVIQDGYGQLISLQQAKTTNVLVVLDPATQAVIRVEIVITDWDDIYQWSEI